MRSATLIAVLAFAVVHTLAHCAQWPGQPPYCKCDLPNGVIDGPNVKACIAPANQDMTDPCAWCDQVYGTLGRCTSAIEDINGFPKCQDVAPAAEGPCCSELVDSCNAVGKPCYRMHGKDRCMEDSPGWDQTCDAICSGYSRRARGDNPKYRYCVCSQYNGWEGVEPDIPCSP